MNKTIGYLHRGDTFTLKRDGNKYKAGHMDEYGYVYCTNVKTHKVKRLYIDSEIEEQEHEVRNSTSDI